MRKFSFILVFVCLIALILSFGLFFKSSNYRALRPYYLFGRKIPSELGLETNKINGSLIVKIPAEEPFYISQTPVTIAQYKRCVKEGKCAEPHYRDEFSKFYFSIFYTDFPVSFVTWDEAKNYCQSYGGDLPTSAQWMKAAGNNKYPWGNTEPTLSKANIDGWYQSQLPAGWLPEGKSAYGILDMSGNVREWVLDENENGEKELKGGGFQDAWRDSEVEENFFHEKSSPGFNRGFRCVFPVK